MATKRWYLTNGVDTNGWQALSETAQSAVTLTAGWVVGTGSTFSSEHNSGAATDRASTTFTANTVPDATLDTTLKDAFRTPILNGTFASANWNFQFAVQSTIQAGAADGQIVFRMLRADADGSNAVQITSAQQSASLCSNVAATDVNGTLTLNPGAFTITNQYLFIQLAWKRTGAGGMTTTNIRLRTGSAATPVGTSILSSDFTPATQSVTGTTMASGVSIPTPAVAVEQPLTGASIGTGALVTAPESVLAEIPVQEVTGDTIGVGSVVTAPTVAYAVGLNTIASTLSLPVPVVAIDQPLTGGTIGSGASVYVPAVGAVTVQEVTGDTVAATSTVFVPTVATGAVTVVGQTLTTGSSVLPPVVTPGIVMVSGVTVPSGLQVRVPTVATGPVTVTGATLASTSQAFAPPTLAMGAVAVTGATRGSTSQVFVPVLQATATGATISSTSVLYAPSATVTVITATRGTTSQVFVPTIALPVAQVTGATRATTSQVFAPTVLGAGVLGAAHLSSTVQVFRPTVVPAAITVGGPTLTNIVQVIAPTIQPGVVTIGGVTRGTTAQLFTPAVTVQPLGPAQGITLPRIGSAAQVFPPFEVYWRRASSRIQSDKVTVRYLVTADDLSCIVLLEASTITVMVLEEAGVEMP